MILSYNYARQKRRRRRTKVPPPQAFSINMVVRRCNTACIAQWRRSGAFIKATKHQHWATTCSISPRRLPGWQQTKRRCKMTILMAIALQRYYTMHITKWRRFLAFVKATKRRHQASTRSDSINWTHLPLILGVYFIVESLKMSLSCLYNNRGVTHQTDEKHLNNMWEK